MTYVIDGMHQSTQMLFATVRIATFYSGGEPGFGTAFFFDHDNSGVSRTYLVTNKHVVAGAEFGEIVFHTTPSSALNPMKPPGQTTVVFEQFEQLWFPHPDPDVDICVVPVTRLKELASGALEHLFYRQFGSHGVKTEEEFGRFPAIMNVAMIGYPDGLWDEQNNLPLIRQGSTASHPGIDFGGRPEVVVDIGCFPGSSGSPVVFYAPREIGSATHYFLGVLYAGPKQTVTGEIVIRPAPVSLEAEIRLAVMIHLGVVIKGREVVNAIEAFEESNRN